jgi:apoptosis-inducing factor 2
VPNILAVLEGREPVALYKKPKEMIVVTVGKREGAGYLGILWGIQLGSWFARFAKGDLFVARNRKVLGQSS